MLFAQATGFLLALGAATAWGGADFSGGLASRRSSPLGVLAVSRLAGLLCYAGLAVATREHLPPVPSIGWAAAAGISGALGIAALYQGLATGRAALVVPVSGVVGAAIPVTFTAIIAGTLPVVQQLGLLTALIGIFLVSYGHGSGHSRWSSAFILGIVAGLGFGGFFIFLGQVESGYVFAPLAIVGCASFTVAAFFLTITRSTLPTSTHAPMALLAGALDATGAVCYLLATRWIRLDVAAVLSSLYPAITVLLFRVVLKESVSRAQWVGLAVCIVAIALIAR